MKCSKCSHYSKGLMRCKYGKINPLNMSVKQGADIAFLMGLSSFCMVDSECLLKLEKIRNRYKELWNGKKRNINQGETLRK